MLLGSVVMSIWGGPGNLIRRVFGFAFLSQLCILALGLRADAALFALAFFVFFSAYLSSMAGAMPSYSEKWLPIFKGQVFATINMICFSCIPLAYVVAGPLAERILNL